MIMYTQASLWFGIYATNGLPRERPSSNFVSDIPLVGLVNFKTSEGEIFGKDLIDLGDRDMLVPESTPHDAHAAALLGLGGTVVYVYLSLAPQKVTDSNEPQRHAEKISLIRSVFFCCCAP